MSWRLALALLFFAAQLVVRPWAPFHESAVYSLRVTVDGRTLDTAQALQRYRLNTWHFSPARDENWETNDLRLVKARIEAVEARGPVHVELRARVDGVDQPVWTLDR